MECFATYPSPPPHPRARWRYAGSDCQEFSMSQMSPAVAAYDQRAADYDGWYDDNPALYRAELDLVGDLLEPLRPIGPGLEVGAGTGRFAAPLGIDTGL